MKRYTCAIDVVILADNPDEAQRKLFQLYDEVAKHPWVTSVDSETEDEEE